MRIDLFSKSQWDVGKSAQMWVFAVTQCHTVIKEPDLMERGKLMGSKIDIRED